MQGMSGKRPAESKTRTYHGGVGAGRCTAPAMQDTIEEGNEIIQLEVASVIGATKDGIQAISMAIEDDDVPTQVSLLLNEILYDPSNSGLDGDANGDGQYSQAEYEFVELINLSTQAIDLSGYML